MEFTTEEEKEVEITDPLKAVHMIQDELRIVNHFVKALRTIGLPVADDLQYCMDNINKLSEDCAKGICRETHERYKDSQQATANMINGIFAFASIDDEAKEG